MAAQTSFFKHAIIPLAFDSSKLHRERLVDMIHAELPRKLIVIIAPAGYGKSTLLADFTAHTEFPVCWVRLTEADQDVMRLASVLAASLQRRFRRLRGQPNLEALSSSPPESLARTFIDLLATRIDESIVIAIDDVQLVNPSEPVMTFLNTFLMEGPPHVTLLVAGRELPELSLAKLVVDGEMVGISLHDLALTRDELLALTKNQLVEELEESDLERLLEDTQGWISGVLLSMALLRDRSTYLLQESQPIVYEYLASVVLDQQSDDLRQFLLDTSVLPIMTSEGCDQVLLREDSRGFLKQLTRKALFITATDQSPRTYEYHPLFRQFLIDTLSELDRKRLNTLRSRAAGYLSTHGSPEDAVELYFEAGAIKRAATLVEKHAKRMFEWGRVQTLEAWAKRIEKTEASTPDLFLYLASAYTDKGYLDAAEKALMQAFEMLEVGKPSKAKLVHAKNVQGLIALQRGRYGEVLKSVEEAERLLTPRSSRLRRATCLRLRARATYEIGGDLEEAERLALDAVKLLEKTDDRYTLTHILFDLSLYQNALGKHLEKQATNLRTHNILIEIGAPLPLAISYNNFAVSAHADGRFDEAFQFFSEGLKFAHQAASPIFQAIILYGQADLFSDLGLHYQAAELYAQGLRLVTPLDHLDLIRYGYVQTSALHRRCGTGKLPIEWLKRAKSLDLHGDQPAMVKIQMAAAMMETTPEEAKATLMEILQEPHGELHANERTLLLYFLARTSLFKDEPYESKAYLQQAMDWAGIHGEEQCLAGEMMYDVEFREFAFQNLPEHPITAVLYQRLEQMKAIGRRYQEMPQEVGGVGHLRLTAFGASEIMYQGQRISGIEPLPKQLVFYLADRGGVERDELLETFWFDVPIGRQTASLYTAMHNIRRFLPEDVIRIEGSTYELNPGFMTKYDVADFEHACRVVNDMPPGDPRRLFALTEAIHTYTGGFLPEFLTDWVVERRRELERRYLDMLTLHADEALTRGHLLQSLESLRQALKLAPLRDDLNLQYLQLLGQLERRSEAVGHYQKYVQLLADELGLDPPESIREAYSQLIK
jgi:ATP/maltotriose-dependent transcriptional regulator MalT/two-component SAPR family response regulator